ncbi:alkaline-phosphatase-like protein [Trichoderma pleuroticola]
MPFVDFVLSKPSLASLLAMSGNTNSVLDSRTALYEPIHWAWLPNNSSLSGFEDWFSADKEYYKASEDPLKLSNLDDLLLPLRGNLGNIPIRHIVFIKLESTRKDVFPLKRDRYIWERLVQSFKNSSLLFGVQKREISMTALAGTPHGGLNANNAFITSTYTLKSLVGTHCSITPLAVDFNVETVHHIYQPCLPHIFEALNQLDHSGDDTFGESFKSFKWKTAFMQSVTMRYDKQDQEAAKLGPVDLTDVNYYGMPEVAVEDYLRDVLASAKTNNERVFLSHLTSSTHHDFGIPTDEDYVSLAGDTDHDDLSHYLNAVGYIDRWLNKILEILDERDVAGETLVVAVGDHGLSIAERGTITPYSNPHVANYHVPLVMSHPKLPHININDAISSIQILPTILDLLIKTKSLSLSKARAVHDMVRNYEGQSVLRPLLNYSEATGQGGWQFTVMNPGGSTIAVRDARQPNWRLVVPVFGNYEWRFTDLETDTHENAPLLSYDYIANLRSVEETAAVTRWWTDENYKRWRYTA